MRDEVTNPMKPSGGRYWSAMAEAVNVLSPEISFVGIDDGLVKPEVSMGRIDMVRNGSFPGVIGGATVSHGNDRNLGDPHCFAIR